MWHLVGLAPASTALTIGKRLPLQHLHWALCFHLCMLSYQPGPVGFQSCLPAGLPVSSLTPPPAPQAECASHVPTSLIHSTLAFGLPPGMSPHLGRAALLPGDPVMVRQQLGVSAVSLGAPITLILLWDWNRGSKPPQTHGLFFLQEIQDSLPPLTPGLERS